MTNGGIDHGMNLRDNKKRYFGNSRNYSLRYDKSLDKFVIRDEINSMDLLFIADDILEVNELLKVQKSRVQGSAGEEMNVIFYLGDADASHAVVSMKGILPVNQDYVEAWGGENTIGQFGKGFLFKHIKATSEYKIYFSTSGKFDGTETWLMTLDSSGNLTVAGTSPFDLKIKDGYVLGSSFTKVGDTYIYDVVFAESYSNNEYIISLQSDGKRLLSFENQVSGGFRINTNSGEPLDTFDRVTWLAKKI